MVLELLHAGIELEATTKVLSTRFWCWMDTHDCLTLCVCVCVCVTFRKGTRRSTSRRWRARRKWWLNSLTMAPMLTPNHT